jgi:hypothetical protein
VAGKSVLVGRNLGVAAKTGAVEEEAEAVGGNLGCIDITREVGWLDFMGLLFLMW